MKTKSLQSIKLRNEQFKNARDKILGLAEKCWMHGITLYVDEDEISGKMHLIDTIKGKPVNHMTKYVFEDNLSVGQYIEKYKLDITADIFHQRIRAGWSIEKAINTPRISNVNKDRVVDGMPLATYCKLNGLKYGRVRARLASGWTLDDAINKQKGYKPNENEKTPPPEHHNSMRAESQRLNRWKDALREEMQK